MMRFTNHSEEQVVAAHQSVKEKNYWLDILSGNPVKSYFPYDYKKTNVCEQQCQYRPDTVSFQFEGELLTGLTDLSKGSDYALHMIMVSVSVILLHKYTGSKDILVGVPIYKQEIEGEFINTVVALRHKLDAHLTYRDLLLQVKNTITGAIEHQNYPVEILAEDLKLTALDNEFPLFELVVLLENIHNQGYIRQVQPNMTYLFLRSRERIEGKLEYNSLLYEKATIERIIAHFRQVLSQILAGLNLGVSYIEVLSETEKRQLLFEFNRTNTAYPRKKTIHQLFEEHVEIRPDQVAVLFGNEQVTYRILNEKANRLAQVLRTKGIGAHQIVGLMLHRSLEMIIGILGILKAGGAYLPLDPTFPGNRLKAMLDDCRSPILLADISNIDRYSFTSFQGILESRVKPQLTGIRPQIQNFAGLPIPDRSLLNYEAYNQYIGQALVQHCISLQATRGCPFKCAYCHKIWPKSHVVRPAENIFAEVQLYYNMGIRRFAFIDDIFNLDVENSSRFLKLIIKNGLDVHLFFPNGLRGDILTKEYIDLMIEAGTIDIAFALETASPRLQSLFNKNLNLKRFRENIEYITQKYPQIILELFTMHGFPTETEAEALMTLDFIKSLQWCHFPYVSVLKIYPNTDMEKIAIENGIEREHINISAELPFHELPETLPFEKSFTQNYQADFFNRYFLSRERLLHVLPYQMNVLTERELLQKYNSYVPAHITTFNDLLQFFNITRGALGREKFLDEAAVAVPNLNEKIKQYFPAIEADANANALKILLLDLSQHFSRAGDQLNDLLEPPLGLLYLMTYLNRQFGDKIEGKIAKSQIDFDNYAELKTLLEEFQPDVIGIRTLTFFKGFFHKTISVIRQWGSQVPIIAGGPYATSSYDTILQDANLDIVVMGEGEITFAELIGKLIENGGKLPHESILKKIAGIAFITAEDRRKERLAREILLFDTIAEEPDKESCANPAAVNNASDPAYVMFTSGSAGKPKGSLTSHYNVTRVVRDTNYIDITGEDRILQLSNYAFDGSVFDIYGALLNGSALVLMKEGEVFLLNEIANLILKEGITVFFVTTALFNKLVEEKLENLANIKRVLFGGEKVSVGHVKRAFEFLGKDRIIHVYGPTETTVFASFHSVNRIDDRAASIPIGKPLANTTTYILDENLSPVPPGGLGELYIGGDGAARGYLNNPELTAEKFIGNPFVENDRLYRTGDLVKCLDDGSIEFIDRIDTQLKIRGFRIELGEIEAGLLKHEAIRDAAVLAGELTGRDRRHQTGRSFTGDGEKYLCAYIVSDTEPDVEEMQKYLSRQLPDYMIPSYFIKVEKIPLTSNGKIDHNALPLPQPTKGIRYAAPRDEVEETLEEIWSGVLGINKENIGIDANFSQLGGHSLSATLIISRVEKIFNVKVPYIEIFSSPTVRELANYVRKAHKKEYIAIEPAQEKEYYELSSAQKRLYFQQLRNPTQISYNIPIVLLMEGNVDLLRMEEIFIKLIDRHESLRTSFTLIDEQPRQKIHRNLDFKIEYDEAQPSFHVYTFNGNNGESKDLHNQVESYVREFVRPFDFSRAPLLRVKVKKMKLTTYLLMIDMHHIITDGTSMGILVREFMLLYEGSELPELRLQYKDFSQWQNHRVKTGEIEKQETFWLRQFETPVSVIDLPTNFARPQKRNYEGSTLDFEIGKEKTQALKAMAVNEETTLFILLLSVFNVFLSKLSGNEDITIATGVAGRIHPDLEGTIGMFVNTLALRNFPAGHKTFKQFFEQVRERTLAAFENQEYQFETLIGKVAKARDGDRNPLCDIVFGLQNVDIKELIIPGLKLTIIDYRSKISRFDMVVVVEEAGEMLTFSVEFSTELFKEETIIRLFDYFNEILSIVIKNQDIKLEDIKISQHHLFDKKINNPQIEFSF